MSGRQIWLKTCRARESLHSCTQVWAKDSDRSLWFSGESTGPRVRGPWDSTPALPEIRFLGKKVLAMSPHLSVAVGFNDVMLM